MMRRIPLLILWVALGSGCTHALHLVHTDQIVPKKLADSKSKKIQSTGEQKVILGIASDTAYVDRAYAHLQNQCDNGLIYSIRTRYSTSHSFLSWTNKVHFEAQCYSR